MPIRNQDKGSVHKYAAAACLSEFEYRRLLREHCGVVSCADPQMTRGDFFRLMSVLELRVEEAIATGEAGPQAARIKDLEFWRKRAREAGYAGPALHRKLLALFNDLQSMIGDRGMPWLLALIAQASSQDTPRASLADCPEREIVQGIEALKLRIRQEWRKRGAAR